MLLENIYAVSRKTKKAILRQMRDRKFKATIGGHINYVLPLVSGGASE